MSAEPAPVERGLQEAPAEEKVRPPTIAAEVHGDAADPRPTEVKDVPSKASEVLSSLIAPVAAIAAAGALGAHEASSLSFGQSSRAAPSAEDVLSAALPTLRAESSAEPPAKTVSAPVLEAVEPPVSAARAIAEDVLAQPVAAVTEAATAATEAAKEAASNLKAAVESKAVPQQQSFASTNNVRGLEQAVAPQNMMILSILLGLFAILLAFWFVFS